MVNIYKTRATTQKNANVKGKNIFQPKRINWS